METAVATANDREHRERLAELGLSSAGIVHDLKSPLTAIQGFVQLCLRSESLDPVLREDLENIDRSAQVCQNIVANVLAVAAMDRAARRSCDVHELIEAAADRGRGVAASSGVVIRRDFHPGPLRVWGSPPDLERALANLIGHAVKAMPAGGALTLRTGRADDAAGRWARIIVEDTSAGLSDEMMARLFKPFHLGADAMDETGLDLYISRQVAVQHGGWLIAENRPGGGVRRALSLPIGCRPPS